MSGDVVDRALEIGAGFDWITPGYALLRGGQVFGVSVYEMAEAQYLIDQAGITSWAWQMIGDMAYFNVADDDAPAVRSLLGYPEPAAAATSGGRSGWWVWAAGAVIVFILAFTLGALVAVGGAL